MEQREAYWGSQIVTIVQRLEGDMVEIERFGRTKVVPSRELSPITQQDEWRGRAFSHLKH